MNWIKLRSVRIVLITIMLATALIVPESLLAQTSSSNWFARMWERLTSRPKRDQRPESRYAGLGNRGLCPYSEDKVVALIPISSATQTSYVEKTISDHPIFRFYVPYDESTGLQAEFIIKDWNEENIYKTVFPLGATPGIVKASLDQNHKLKVGQQYRWIFSLICNPNNRSEDITVNGLIERVNADSVIPKNFSKFSEEEHIKLYADNLLWFDFLNTLIKLNQAYPEKTEYKQHWDSLLRKIGLSDRAISQSRKTL